MEMNKAILIIGLLIILVSGCGLTEKKCKEVALLQAAEYQDLGYALGFDVGLDKCDEEYGDKYCTTKGEEGTILIIKQDEYSGWQLNPNYPNCEQTKEEVLKYLDTIECKGDD